MNDKKFELICDSIELGIICLYLIISFYYIFTSGSNIFIIWLFCGLGGLPLGFSLKRFLEKLLQYGENH